VENPTMASAKHQPTKIRFFDVTLRVSSIILISFLHSLGLKKMQILWKKSAQTIFFIPATILIFLKNFFSKKIASY
jgi:hypothetical protein